MKKLLVVGVIILFLGLACTPPTGFDVIEQSKTLTSKGKILYVGGSGPNNYTKVKDAIDEESEGLW